MQWIIVVAIGVIIGTIVNSLWRALTNRMQLPRLLCVTIATLGALAGGVLATISRDNLTGTWSFYLISILTSIGFVSGGVFDFYLTGKEERRT